MPLTNTKIFKKNDFKIKRCILHSNFKNYKTAALTVSRIINMLNIVSVLQLSKTFVTFLPAHSKTAQIFVLKHESAWK